MTHGNILLRLILLLCSGLAVGNASAATVDRTKLTERTALDRYVAAPDTNYNFRLVSTTVGEGATTYVLELTSQAWLTTNEVNQPIWKHWLTIVRPAKVKGTTGLLFIGGGSTRTNPPSKPDAQIPLIASATDTIVAELRNVPNQPLIFAGEKKGRTEDSLIAYSWDKFLRTGDEKWPARLPMTKAAVRAMDAVTAFCATNETGKATVDKFFIAGASKRGWTTWTTAAVDNRVVAIAPIVIDMLNIIPSFRHHFEAYGFWAPAIGDYTREHIMDWDSTPEYRALMKIEEPYEYRQRLTIPKFIINASGDQFFLPDSAQFYFDDLPGVKYLRYVPNADHSLRNSDALMTLLACYSAVVKEAKLPQFSWSMQADGGIRVKNSDKPDAVKLWQVTNPEKRDFRLDATGPEWKSRDLKDEGGGVYLGQVEKPEKGWTAYFVELTYNNGAASPFKFTTPVRVAPDVLPHKFVPGTRPK